MSDEDQLTLLASDEMLVKRPIPVGGDFVPAGFREKERTDMLGTDIITEEEWTR